MSQQQKTKTKRSSKEKKKRMCGGEGVLVGVERWTKKDKNITEAVHNLESVNNNREKKETCQYTAPRKQQKWT